MNTFYLDAARRLARKRKLLAQGEAEQTELEKAHLKRLQEARKREARRKAQATAARERIEKRGARSRRGEAEPGRAAGVRAGPSGGSGRPAPGPSCPGCRRALERVVCLQKEVRVCPGCRGVWIPYEVARGLAQESDWFGQLGASVRRALEI
jgi:hypothetical protein